MSELYSEVQVGVKDRMRLVTAVLAASHWPQMEQKIRTHAVHPHAKEIQRFVQPYQTHPAVVLTNELLAQHVPVEDLFTAALRSSWPDLRPFERLPGPLMDGRWVMQLEAFLRDTGISERFWSRHHAVWEEAKNQLCAIFAGIELPQLLVKVVQKPLPQQIMVIPNLGFPALSTLVAETGQNMYVIVPPLLAVGESPPWPYHEDPPAVLVNVWQALLTHLMGEQWAAQEQAKLHGLTVLFLETAVDEAEAMSYMVRAKKQHLLPELPGVVETLRQA